MLGKITKHTNHPITMNEVLCLQTINILTGTVSDTQGKKLYKATPHNPCASDTQLDFSSECINLTQAG